MDKLDQIVASFDLEGLTARGFKINFDKFIDLFQKGEAILLDIRTEEEVKFLPLTAFGINIPLHKLPERLNEIPKDKVVALYCPGGHRSSMAYLYLRAKGFDNIKVLGISQEELAGKIRPPLVKKLLNK